MGREKLKPEAKYLQDLLRMKKMIVGALKTEVVIANCIAAEMARANVIRTSGARVRYS
jgi:hypothetical protein